MADVGAGVRFLGEPDEFGITVQLTAEQANRLADLLRPNP